jgi:hypothetical protein
MIFLYSSQKIKIMSKTMSKTISFIEYQKYNGQKIGNEKQICVNIIGYFLLQVLLFVCLNFIRQKTLNPFLSFFLPDVCIIIFVFYFVYLMMTCENLSEQIGKIVGTCLFWNLMIIWILAQNKCSLIGIFLLLLYFALISTAMIIPVNRYIYMVRKAYVDVLNKSEV